MMIIEMINLAAVDLNLLVAFHALLLERNVTRAADRVGVAQPSMSGTLARLRALFDDELFVRTPDGMRPTARALELAEPINQALQQIQIVLDRTPPFMPSTAQRTFTIGATYYANFALLPALVAMLRREGPNIDVAVQPLAFQDAVRLLDDASIDLAIGVLADVPKRLFVRTLFADKIVCIARRDHAALGHGLSLKEFIELPHVRISVPGDPTEAVDAMLSREGLKRRSAIVLPNFYAVALVVANSDLIATVPERLTTALPIRHELAVYELPFDLPPPTLGVAWSKHGHSDSGIQWLRDRTCEVLLSAYATLKSVDDRHIRGLHQREAPGVGRRPRLSTAASADRRRGYRKP